MSKFSVFLSFGLATFLLLTNCASEEKKEIPVADPDKEEVPAPAKPAPLPSAKKKI